MFKLTKKIYKIKRNIYMYAFDRPMALPICRVSSLRRVPKKNNIYRIINKHNIYIYSYDIYIRIIIMMSKCSGL